MGRCDHPKLQFDSFGDAPTGDVLSAGEGVYSACQPITGPDFGCIHFEQKELP